MKNGAGGVHEQLWQKMPVKRNRRMRRRVDYPEDVGENDVGVNDLALHSARLAGFGFLSFNRGPVAQLGARFHGMEEVVGSIPTRSTIFKYLQLSPFPAW